MQAGRVVTNQLVWAPPNELNLKTLWGSMNLFDTQLLLRPGDILQVRAGAWLGPHCQGPKIGDHEE